MDIRESDYAEINKALVEPDIFYDANTNFAADIVEKAQAIFDECCNLPAWRQADNYMDAGLGGVEVYLRKTYPWLTENAIYAVRHECMMYMK